MSEVKLELMKEIVEEKSPLKFDEYRALYEENSEVIIGMANMGNHDYIELVEYMMYIEDCEDFLEECIEKELERQIQEEMIYYKSQCDTCNEDFYSNCNYSIR